VVPYCEPSRSFASLAVIFLLLSDDLVEFNIGLVEVVQLLTAFLL
jgi:hypothetical protein